MGLTILQKIRLKNPNSMITKRIEYDFYKNLSIFVTTMARVIKNINKKELVMQLNNKMKLISCAWIGNTWFNSDVFY